MVELEGVEPSSKRGNHMLSTGLSLLEFSSHNLDRATGPWPYLLKFHSRREAERNYPRFDCTTVSTSFGARASGWCLVTAPSAVIKQIYCTSIKQQEQNCCCQIIVDCLFIVRTDRALPAYIPFLPAVKAKQPHGIVYGKHMQGTKI